MITTFFTKFLSIFTYQTAEVLLYEINGVHDEVASLTNGI